MTLICTLYHYWNNHEVPHVIFYLPIHQFVMEILVIHLDSHLS